MVIVRLKYQYQESASDLIYDNPGPIWTRKTVEGLSQGAELYLVAVDQSDKEKQWAERDGTSQHGFHQQHCPTTQQEDVDKQPEDTERSTTHVTKIKSETKQWIGTAETIRAT